MSRFPESTSTPLLKTGVVAITALAIGGSLEQPASTQDPNVIADTSHVIEMAPPEPAPLHKYLAKTAINPNISSTTTMPVSYVEARPPHLQYFPHPKPHKVHHKSTPTLPAILKRIGGCESAGSPNAKIDYRAENQTSTASGGFQFLDTTWNNYHGYSRAMYAPPKTQKRRAIIEYHQHGTSPWVSSQACWG